MMKRIFTLYSLTPWSLAACGFLTALGNLFGLTDLALPIFPEVEHLGGLIATSLLLFSLGLIPLLFVDLPQRKKKT